jgi:hypothetical protein
VDDLDSADGSLHLHVGAVITSLRGWQFAMSATPGFFFFFTMDWIYMLYVCVRDGDLSQLGRVQQARDFTCSRSSLNDVIYWLNNASGIYVYRLDNLYSFSEAAWIAAPLTIWLNRSLSSSLGLAEVIECFPTIHGIQHNASIYGKL